MRTDRPAYDYGFDCAECGKRVNPTDFHPYLYCELVKLGHRDPEAYLRSCGFTRREVRSDG